MSTAVEGTVTVQPGDSLSKIAAARYVDQVYAMNRATIGDNPDQIQVGQVLTLPGSWGDHLHVKVEEGDTLSGIVAEWLWLPVYVANHATVGVDPDIIQPGMVLDIPELS